MSGFGCRVSGFGDYRPWTSGCELRTTDYGLRTTVYGPRTTDYRPWTTDMIYYDGICNLCNFWIRWVRRFDKNGVFQFKSLQSANQEGVLRGEVLKMDSVVYSKEGVFYFESDAILKIIYDLGGKFRFLYFFLSLFPRFFRQAIYRLIARNRYRFFGTCELDGNR